MYIRNEKGFSFFPAEISPQCTQKSHQIIPVAFLRTCLV